MKIADLRVGSVVYVVESNTAWRDGREIIERSRYVVEDLTRMSRSYRAAGCGTREYQDPRGTLVSLRADFPGGSSFRDHLFALSSIRGLWDEIEPRRRELQVGIRAERARVDQMAQDLMTQRNRVESRARERGIRVRQNLHEHEHVLITPRDLDALLQLVDEAEKAGWRFVPPGADRP